MKKYLLTLIALVCAVTGAWAEDATISGADYSKAIITTNGAGNLTTETLGSSIFTNILQWRSYVKIIGAVNSTDVTNLANANYSIDGNNSGGTVLDFSEAIADGNVTFTAKSEYKGVRLPVGFDLASYSGPQTFVYYIDGSDVYIRIIDSENGLNDIKKLSNNNSWSNAPANGKTVYLSGNYGDFETARTFLKDANNAGATEVIKVAPVSNDPYTVSGCDIIINMSKAEAGKTFDEVLSEAKAAMTAADATQTNICTLIVQYDGMTNNELASLGDAIMTGATRIDLSGVKLASGADIYNINVPASLTSLVLPEDQTVSTAFATKLGTFTNLNYAYSPSSDSQKPAASSTSSFNENKNFIADYVWVNKAGGLAQAFINEEQLRNSYYIKVASSVALNPTDVDFNGLGTYKPTNYLFLDFSASNLTPAMAASYTVTDEIGYRIILPNDWSVDDMSVFAASSTKGNLAAVYSYSGTTLKIMEITDGTYAETALKNPRIVRSGTTEIEVVGKIVEDNGNWYQYGDLGTNLIKALNQADDEPDDASVNNIKTININVGQANTILTEIEFTNTNIEHFIMSGVENKNNPSTGPGVDVSGCTNLRTIDVSNSTLQLLDASGLTSLESVNMNGTMMTNANGLSGETILTGCTSLTSFVTSSTTEFKKDVKLINTGLNSFATSAKVTGDIYLNASTSIASVDLTSTQFQNTTSIVHIDKSATEDSGNPDAIDALSRTESGTAVKTIMVPNGFASSTRIHPYADVENNIQAQAASGDGGKDNDGCFINYDATTKTATVHTKVAGHLANLLSTGYALYPEGTTFKFASECVINENDLKALTGYITTTDNTTNDRNWRSNYYYVDMYDLTATDALCGETGVIGNTITWMRTNNRQFKGLILPKDQTAHGYGTTLIKDADNADPAQATCTEFIAYYSTGTSATDDEQLVAHIYNVSNTNSDAYQASFDIMKTLLDTHTVTREGETVAEVTTDADLYLISTNSKSKIDITALPSDKTIIETINNEMVGTQTGKASVYVYPDTSGAIKDAVDNTGIENTPTELIQVNGAMNPDDFTAINSFVDGPRVLDLKNVTSTITKAMLESLTNSNIEYIILPEGMATKAEVCGPTYSSSMTNLKAVIASTSTTCVAYVNEAGSLAEARYYATGGSKDANTGLYTPDVVGLQNVILSGNLNAADIAANAASKKVDANGHWSDESGNLVSTGLPGEHNTITSIDLEDAVFGTMSEGVRINQTDMNFSLAGLNHINDVKLPTDPSMTLICENCFEGIATLIEICIPYNYTKIDNGAFLNTLVEHITTTDSHGALIDNGANTYTLSANLQEIGTNPGYTNGVPNVLSANQTVFPQNRLVKETYVLATKTPKCYAGAFPANMVNGWGGFNGTMEYCRDKYENNGNWYCVLRFPSLESYNAVTDADKKDATYALMKQQYTDVNKIYTKKEQTGAVDANGEEITWPTFAETLRVYGQATAGLTWVDWDAAYNGQQDVNTAATYSTDDYTLSKAATSEGDYDFQGYEGWHQFVLSQATYVEPDETVVDEKIVREYEDAGWFTICIPYDLTEKQVREWLGVPQSEGNVICKYKGDEIDTSAKTKMPDIRQLTSVTRHTSTGGSDKNKVIFRLTTDLYNNGTPQFMNFDLTADKNNRFSQQSVNGNGSYTADTKVCLKGGIPYIIKAYKRKGVKISGYNIGQYIMTHYADEFKEAKSCLHSGVKYYEYLGAAGTAVSNQLQTLKFAKPYEEHQIVAMNDAAEASYLDYNDNGTTREYRYALVGQFWTQKLPKYCFYQSKGVWYRNTSDSYNWSAYKCVIMAVPTITEPDLVGHMYENGNFRNNPTQVGVEETGKSFYPSIEANTDDKLNGTLKIVFADGRDDDDFAASAKYIFAFDDGIVEYDETGNEATAIDKLDGVDVTPLPDNYKVYNINGQYVGDSLEGLGKGLYIVNGKKYIVR